MSRSHYCYSQADSTLPCDISVLSILSYPLIILTDMDFGFLRIELIVLCSGNYLTTKSPYITSWYYLQKSFVETKFQIFLLLLQFLVLTSLTNFLNIDGWIIQSNYPGTRKNVISCSAG